MPSAALNSIPGGKRHEGRCCLCAKDENKFLRNAIPQIPAHVQILGLHTITPTPKQRYSSETVYRRPFPNTLWMCRSLSS